MNHGTEIPTSEAMVMRHAPCRDPYASTNCSDPGGHKGARKPSTRSSVSLIRTTLEAASTSAESVGTVWIVDNFDDKAQTWDQPDKIERANVIAAAIKTRVPLDKTTRLLEYGAGTGLVSVALSDAVGPITMADTSTGMREVMETKIAGGVLPDARIWDLDLSQGGGVPDERFDLLVTALVLHHIEDLDAALDSFARLLEPGGHLCVADLDHEDGSFHGDGFGGHHGFKHEDLAASLTKAGFKDVSFQPCHSIEKDGRNYSMFLAIAVR